MNLKNFRKFAGAVLGGVTGGAIIWVVNLLGGTLDPAAAASIAGGLASLGTLLAPKNVKAG